MISIWLDVPADRHAGDELDPLGGQLIDTAFDVLLGHPELELHPELIVPSVREGPIPRGDFFELPFIDRPDQGGAVHGIPSEPTELPAKETVYLAA